MERAMLGISMMDIIRIEVTLQRTNHRLSILKCQWDMSAGGLMADDADIFWSGDHVQVNVVWNAQQMAQDRERGVLCGRSSSEYV